MAGLDWVAAHHKAKQGGGGEGDSDAIIPSVVNLSLGTQYSAAMNSAAAALASLEGVTVVVAAGNDDINACYSSPSSCSSVVTVAATTPFDRRAYYSNYGERKLDTSHTYTCCTNYPPLRDNITLHTWIFI
jgi:subtilisin family serine protease